MWRCSLIIFVLTLGDLLNELKIDTFGKKVSHAGLKEKDM